MVTFRNPLANREAAQHQVFNANKTGRNALDVMDEAGALFTVNYPSATYMGDAPHMIETPRHTEVSTRTRTM